jgi:hypothetical protein
MNIRKNEVEETIYKTFYNWCDTHIDMKTEFYRDIVLKLTEPETYDEHMYALNTLRELYNETKSNRYMLFPVLTDAIIIIQRIALKKLLKSEKVEI